MRNPDIHAAYNNYTELNNATAVRDVSLLMNKRLSSQFILYISEVDFREDLRYLHRYLTVSRCEHEVLSDQGPPADQPAPELQRGHVGT